MFSAIADWRETVQRERMQPDLARALRCVIAFMGPLLAVHFWNLAVEATFAAIAGQNIAMMDVRGAYPLRLGLFAVAAAALAGAAWLGTMVGGTLALSLLAVLVMMLATGAWRHLSPEYGPSVAVSSALLFLIALAHPGGTAAADGHFLSALIGGSWGVIVQVALWPFRPQHPRRRDVADTWLALSEVVAAISVDGSASSAERDRVLIARQSGLRTALDHATAMLSLATSERHHAHLSALKELNTLAARLATRVVVLNHSLDALRERADFAALAPSFAPLLNTLANTSRSIALTTVSRQPAHLATCEVRLKRLENLAKSLQDRVTAQTNASAVSVQLIFILEQVVHLFGEALTAMRATVDRRHEQGAFSLELLDLQTWSLRPLASALNLQWRPNPTLIRFIYRATVLQLVGVGIFKVFHLERGYWLPLTMFVVLQPEYGATRLRAAQRVVGTLAASVVASGLLFLPLEPEVLMAAMAFTIAGFAFWIKRDYSISVFFITLFVVLLTETSAKITVAFTVERLAATAAGGALALLAAYLFWPVWERTQFPGFLASALRANRVYVRALADRLVSGEGYDAALIADKRAAEIANGQMFTSLSRMSGDPKRRQGPMEQAAALANGNQRLTRAFTAIAVTLTPGARVDSPEFSTFAAIASDALEALAVVAPSGTSAEVKLAAFRTSLNDLALPSVRGAGSPLQHALVGELSRSVTELSAMLLSADRAEDVFSGGGFVGLTRGSG